MISTSRERRASVTSFTDSHPEFASLAADPGTVLFDHHQHLQPGQVNPGDRGGFTLDMVPKSARGKYKLNAGGYIQLECSDCHAPDGDPDGTIKLASDDELGRYLAPIEFETHCAACHALAVGIESLRKQSPPLPHAVPWDDLDLLLAAALNGARATEAVRLPRDDTQETPVPGEGHGKPAPDGFRVSDSEVTNLRDRVRRQCLKCHSAGSIDETPSQPKPHIPARWFQFGLFDHAAHRAFDCQHCHKQAYPITNRFLKAPPVDQTVVMIANRESCVGCHRDAKTATPAGVLELTRSLPMWASDGCTLCHRYHDHSHELATARSGADAEAQQ